MNLGRHYIHIVSIPPGEAPLWVREKWVGLALPLAGGDRGSRETFTSGVLTGPRNRLIAIWWRLLGRLPRKSGYAVDVGEALGILDRTAPDAASWWRANVPRLLAPRRKFLFQPSACEMVDATA
jgi:hypothetical protein